MDHTAWLSPWSPQKQNKKKKTQYSSISYLEHLSNTLQAKDIAPKNTAFLEQSLNSFAVVKLPNNKNLISTIVRNEKKKKNEKKDS